MILLHAVTRPPVDDAAADGLQQRTSGEVSVLFTESGQPDLSAAAVVAHGQRITALAERFPLLPMRYGTTLDSLADLDALVVEHRDEWSRRLAVVDGHRELLVHVPEPAGTSTPPATGRPATGRDYLRRRADALHERDRVWGAVTDAVRPHALEHRALPDGRRLAVLVSPEHEADLRKALTALAGRENLAIAVTGPWPPFSFCEERPDRG